LSGTCLIDEGYQIRGVVIGNSKDEVNVFTKTTVEDEEKKVIVMTNETMYIGLAIDKTKIFNIQSEKMGMTIHEYLIKNKLHKCSCNTKF